MKRRKVRISIPTYDNGGGSNSNLNWGPSSKTERKKLLSDVGNPPDMIITLKDDKDYIDGISNWAGVSGADRVSINFNDQIKQALYSGKYGYNPATGQLINLAKANAADKQTTLPESEKKYLEKREDVPYEQAIAEWNKDRVPVQIERGETSWNPSFEFQGLGRTLNTQDFGGGTVYMTQKEADDYLQAQLLSSTEATQRNPLWYAPGMIYTAGAAPALDMLIGAGSAVGPLSEGKYGEAALTAGLGALPFTISKAGTISKQVDKAIYPKRTWRASSTIGENIDYAADLRTQALAEKIAKQGEFTTSDLGELEFYLRGNTGRKGLLMGDDMTLTEYKVPFWKRNVSENPDVVSLKELQGSPVNKSEYIIPSGGLSKFLYPRKTTLLKGAPEYLTKMDGFDLRTSIPFSYESPMYYSNFAKYLEDQMNAAITPNVSFAKEIPSKVRQADKFEYGGYSKYGNLFQYPHGGLHPEDFKPSKKKKSLAEISLERAAENQARIAGTVQTSDQIPTEVSAKPIPMKLTASEEAEVQKRIARDVKAAGNKDYKDDIALEQELRPYYQAALLKERGDWVRGLTDEQYDDLYGQSWYSRAYDIATNPLDAFKYSVTTGDFRNMPKNYSDYEAALAETGESDPYGVDWNPVASALEAAYWVNPQGWVNSYKAIGKIPSTIKKASTKIDEVLGSAINKAKSLSTSTDSKKAFTKVIRDANKNLQKGLGIKREEDLAIRLVENPKRLGTVNVEINANKFAKAVKNKPEYKHLNISSGQLKPNEWYQIGDMDFSLPGVLDKTPRKLSEMISKKGINKPQFTTAGRGTSDKMVFGVRGDYPYSELGYSTDRGLNQLFLPLVGGKGVPSSGLSAEVRSAINQAAKSRGYKVTSGGTGHEDYGAMRYIRDMLQGRVDPITDASFFARRKSDYALQGESFKNLMNRIQSNPEKLRTLERELKEARDIVKFGGSSNLQTGQFREQLPTLTRLAKEIQPVVFELKKYGGLFKYPHGGSHDTDNSLPNYASQAFISDTQKRRQREEDLKSLGPTVAKAKAIDELRREEAKLKSKRREESSVLNTKSIPNDPAEVILAPLLKNLSEGINTGPGYGTRWSSFAKRAFDLDTAQDYSTEVDEFGRPTLGAIEQSLFNMYLTRRPNNIFEPYPGDATAVQIKDYEKYLPDTLTIPKEAMPIIQDALYTGINNEMSQKLQEQFPDVPEHVIEDWINQLRPLRDFGSGRNYLSVDTLGDIINVEVKPDDFGFRQDKVNSNESWLQKSLINTLESTVKSTGAGPFDYRQKWQYKIDPKTKYGILQNKYLK